MTQALSRPAPGEATRELRALLMTPSVSQELARVLPKGLSPERMVRQTLTLAQKNPTLLQCTPISVLAGMIQAAELGLELSGALGQAYLVPRWNTKKSVNEATFQLGYRGLIDLAFRSDRVASFQLRTVYSKEEFSVSYGSYGQIKHIPVLQGDRGEPIAYYAVISYARSGHDFEVITKSEAEEHRRKYAAKNKVWDSNFDEMAMKTAAIKLAHRVPISVDFQGAAILDNLNVRGVEDQTVLPPSLSRTEALEDRLVGALGEDSNGEDTGLAEPQEAAG